MEAGAGHLCEPVPLTGAPFPAGELQLLLKHVAEQLHAWMAYSTIVWSVVPAVVL